MNNMVLALEITALGMGLVFAAIIVLWGMMSLLTAITAEKDISSPHSATALIKAESVPVKSDDIKAQVAAVAVAIALAEQQASHAHPFSEPPTAMVSAWQIGMRTRQMYQKGVPLRRHDSRLGER
jgi:Na+-transporting methylmalonyl-CoA/oxaloacetate decarboxylase gamma subunit